ncbi:MAG: GNAT family N-acetyltransferase [Alphaproteobacteria bacterium]
MAPDVSLPAGLALEPARSADFEALFTLIDESFAPLLGPAGQWDRARERRMFRRSFTPGRDLVLRACGQDGSVAGLWSVAGIPGGRVLLYAVLAPQWRNRGIGSRLLAALTGEADANGIPLELTVHRLNRASALYERVGFRAVLETDTKLRMRYSPSLRQWA